MRKFLYIAVLSVVATLAFQSVAAAQYVDATSPGDCSGLAELADPQSRSELFYLPDAGGCIDVGGAGAYGPLTNTLNDVVFDADTGEQLGVAKDLDPDLSGGANSVTHQEFCGDFAEYVPITAQEYYDQEANAAEQAILDPDGDGSACASDTDDGSGGGGTDVPGQSSGEDDPCAGANEQLGISSDVSGSFGGIFFPDAGGCIYLTGALVELTLDQLNAPVHDSDTGEELGMVKDLDPDLTSGDFSVSYEEFCGAFPTPEAEGFSYAGLTAQEYYDQLANEREKAILDPNGDGLACTPDDDAFLSGDAGGGGETDFEQTWTGSISQFGEGGDVELEYGVEADIVPLSDMSGDMIGEVVGEVRYTAGCGGVWVLTEVGEDSVVVEEQITEGTDTCAEIVPIALTPQEDGTLEYRTVGEYDGVSEGVLSRQDGSEDGPGDDDTRLPSERMRDIGIIVLPDTGGPAFLPPAGTLLAGTGLVGLVALVLRRLRQAR